MHYTATPLLYAALVAVFSQNASTASGQGFAFDPDPLVDLGAPAFVALDKVGADLSSAPARKERSIYLRTVSLRADGLYAVRITDTQERVRMEGTYLDRDLKVPHGHFVYYHPGAGFESTGEYRMGRKVGTWTCVDRYGAPRADRHYHGMNWEEMQVALGLATLAH